MKDYLGNKLTVGDEVAYMQLGYRSLSKGFITRISEQTVWISYKISATFKESIKQSPNQVIGTKYVISDSLGF